jgi:hypothetical protein
MILFSGTIAVTVISSCEKDEEDNNDITTCELTREQQQGLLYMREEEKLARDVYNYLYEKWNVNIFKNIAKSEQHHMDLLLDEVDLCKFEDPVLPEAGKFTNSHIQELYDALTTKGDKSLIDALEVGATIEDVDIYDLNNFSDQTDNKTLLEIYDILTCGSRNHMRAFTGWLENKEEKYSPQFISTELYDSIINGEHENCGQ